MAVSMMHAERLLTQVLMDLQLVQNQEGRAQRKRLNQAQGFHLLCQPVMLPCYPVKMPDLRHCWQWTYQYEPGLSCQLLHGYLSLAGRNWQMQTRRRQRWLRWLRQMQGHLRSYCGCVRLPVRHAPATAAGYANQVGSCPIRDGR